MFGMEEDHSQCVVEEEEEEEAIVLLEQSVVSLSFSSSSSDNLSDDVLRSTVAFFVPDEGGRALWTRHFPALAQIPFANFVAAVRTHATDQLSEARKRRRKEKKKFFFVFFLILTIC